MRGVAGGMALGGGLPAAGRPAFTLAWHQTGNVESRKALGYTPRPARSKRKVKRPIFPRTSW
jgi:hypothetical protein